jgi:hypothetical protein
MYSQLPYYPQAWAVRRAPLRSDPLLKAEPELGPLSGLSAVTTTPRVSLLFDNTA